MRREDVKLTQSELDANADFIAACRMNVPMSNADAKAARDEKAKERNRIASSESHRRARAANRKQTDER